MRLSAIAGATATTRQTIVSSDSKAIRIFKDRTLPLVQIRNITIVKPNNERSFLLISNSIAIVKSLDPPFGEPWCADFCDVLLRSSLESALSRFPRIPRSFNFFKDNAKPFAKVVMWSAGLHRLPEQRWGRGAIVDVIDLSRNFRFSSQQPLTIYPFRDSNAQIFSLGEPKARNKVQTMRMRAAPRHNPKRTRSSAYSRVR